jgi:exodeoxyribonuclease VII small subunit
MSSQPASRGFEALLIELQETVSRLETDEMTLAEAIGAYERSVELANECSRMLDEAELRISTIDAASREIREESVVYRLDPMTAASLLLGNDEDDLADLLDDE